MTLACQTCQTWQEKASGLGSRCQAQGSNELMHILIHFLAAVSPTAMLTSCKPCRQGKFQVPLRAGPPYGRVSIWHGRLGPKCVSSPMIFHTLPRETLDLVRCDSSPAPFYFRALCRVDGGCWRFHR